MASVPALVPELFVERSGEKALLPEHAAGAVETWRGNDGFEAYGYEAGGFYWAQLPGLAVYRFDDRSSDVVAIPDADAVDARVRDAYHRNVLPLVLQLRGHEALHASAVETEDGLLVLCGVSGAGKSTFADRLARRGYPAWADDAVVLDLDRDDVAALPVPFRLSVRGDAADIGAAGHGRLQPLPVRALAILKPAADLGPRPVETTRLAPGSAFTALLTHAYFFRLSDPERNATLVRRYLRLASIVPTFDVRYRPDLARIEAVLDELERSVLGAAR